MKHVRFENTGKRGWFVGDFPEAAFQTKDAEVCYCIEQPGDGVKHYHTVCTETVFIISGKLICQGKEYSDGDILVFAPGDINDAVYLTETVMIGVKTPAGKDDKVIY
jgi:quercetin dioxygenase-like cupin family protein